MSKVRPRPRPRHCHRAAGRAARTATLTAAFTATLALAAPVAALAEPAPACACEGVRVYDAGSELRYGRALAVVTQTNDAGDGLRLRVDDAKGPFPPKKKPTTPTKPPPPLPAVLTGKAAASGCGYVPFGAIKAVAPYVLAPDTKKAAWSAAGCRDTDVGDALQQIAGDPPTTSTAPPVAVLAGGFGDSGLVAIDARGEVVAWDRTKSRLTHVAACPGGGTVVSWDDSYKSRLTVRDTRTLAQIRTLSMPANVTDIDRLRCADTAGTQAQVIVAAPGASAASTLHTVTEHTTSTVPVQVRLGDAFAVRDGFLGTTRAGGRSLVRIDADGRVRVLRVDFPQLEHLTLSSDGRTLAGISGAGRSAGPAASVLTFSSGDGAALGSWRPETPPDALAWIGSDRLAVRVGHVNREAPYRTGEIEVRDRLLRAVGNRPSAPGSLAGVGEVVLGYGDTRLSLTAAQGPPRVVDNLWLAGATQVVSLLDTGPERSVLPSTGDRLPLVLGGVALVVVGLAASTRRGVRS